MNYFYLIWRKEHVLRIDQLNVIEWQILGYIQSNICLSELYDKIHLSFPEVAFDTLLPKFVMNGWLAECEFLLPKI